VVKELIQGELNSINLEKELRLIIEPGKHRKKMRDDFMKLREKLGGKGASERTAIAMLKRIKESRLEKQQAF
jgi:lipid-A-disaccharide synthase